MFTGSEGGSKSICCCFRTGERFRKHRVRPEPRGGAQFGYAGGLLTSASFRPGKNWKPLQQSATARADGHYERLTAVWNWTDIQRTPVLHLRWDICVENLRILTPQTGCCGRSSTCNVLPRWDEQHSRHPSCISKVLSILCAETSFLNVSELRSCGLYDLNSWHVAEVNSTSLHPYCP